MREGDIYPNIYELYQQLPDWWGVVIRRTGDGKVEVYDSPGSTQHPQSYRNLVMNFCGAFELFGLSADYVVKVP